MYAVGGVQGGVGGHDRGVGAQGALLGALLRLVFDPDNNEKEEGCQESEDEEDAWYVWCGVFGVFGRQKLNLPLSFLSPGAMQWFVGHLLPCCTVQS